jgi:hypothetical protein
MNMLRKFNWRVHEVFAKLFLRGRVFRLRLLNKKNGERVHFSLTQRQTPGIYKPPTKPKFVFAW